MTEYRWAHIRERTIQQWGSTPQGQLEQDILDIFQNHPALVVQTIEKLTVAHQNGKIHSPWAVLRKDLQQATTPERTPTVTDHNERNTALAKAESWIRTTGIHYPNETEIINHLFAEAEQTAPLEYLQHIERTTRNNPGRYLYDALLKASIKHTRKHGTQDIPGTAPGPLNKHRTTKTRDRILELYRELRPQGILVEQQAEQRATKWLNNTPIAKRLHAKPRKEPTP